MSGADVSQAPAGPADPSPALAIEGLSRAFGGVRAIQEVTADIPAGAVTAVIGPNGAGKTTLINLITGIYLPHAGTIRLFGAPVTGNPPERLARLGMARTFQNLRVCMNMSAEDNVMIGAHLSLPSGLFAGMFRLPSLRRADVRCRDEAHALMKRVGIARYAGMLASGMPYGALKQLEIARALAARPRLLLLDEPAAGLNATEKVEIARLIGDIARDGTTIILVEHDMRLVMGVSDHVIVLDHGMLLASGTPDEIRADPAVVAAYLGTAS
ncbi:MAG TPA: ABC transporter ATP-binding protein [Burkholderiaceae bacterium]|nr:ABC transporter ATP-binding protein [Burkholderiaceae bacterium]